MNGFLLIDKASGINSFKLVLALRKIAAQKRVGFAGTLDPLASGLMVLALGEYTKLLSYLEAKDKVYQVTMRFGVVSDTYDIDGQVVPFVNLEGVQPPPTLGQIEAALARDFTGEINQIPPRFSALRIDGKRAYDMAREGQQFEMKARPVQIFSSKVLEYNFPELSLEVHCSSGMYIRSLAHDLGQKLGCGAVVSVLRRTKVGKLDVGDSVLLDKLNDAPLSSFFVQPEKVLAGVFPEEALLKLEEGDYEVLARGNFIGNSFGLPVGGVGLAFFRGEVVGVVETVEEGSKLKFKKKLLIF
jgi:tRNA pseudouridine55 synthase